MSIKSPFYVVENFISPLLCEDIIELCDFNVPDYNKDDRPIPTVRSCEHAEQIIYERLTMLFPELQAYYQLLYKGTERVQFEWFPQGTSGSAHAENSEHVRGKWLKTKQRDLSAVLFLTDYQDATPFEAEYEVYGGKLEFPQHRFSFQPKRGTIVIFPSDPHFINITTNVLVGDLHQARIQMAAATPYLYNPKNFEGNYTIWFAPLLNPS